MSSRIAVIGAAAVAVGCCAGLPAVAATLGGLTAGALIGVAAGVLTAAGFGVGVVLFVRSLRQRTRPESWQ